MWEIQYVVSPTTVDVRMWATSKRLAGRREEVVRCG
jgi:hypothetical protein